MGYTGIFSAEFKYDHRDGEFKILEMNARPWWYVDFAASCGVDVCWMAYQDALGLPVEPVTTYEVGRRCVYPVQDLRACWHLWRNGRSDGGVPVASWLGASQPVFGWEDPLPALDELRYFVRKVATKTVRAVRARAAGGERREARRA